MTPRNRLAASLAQKLAGVRADPEFRGASLEIQTTREHEWVIAGPAETSKTWACLWKLDTDLRSTPGAQAVLVRKKRTHMNGTVLRTWRQLITIRGGVKVNGGNNPDSYDYPNGSRLYVIGMDDPQKVLSGEYDWIVVNQAEELSKTDWEMLSMRCTGRGAVTQHPAMYGDCNPGPPTHFLKHRDGLKMF